MNRVKGTWAGLLVAGLAALSFSATGCGSAIEVSESVGESSNALSTSLTARAGTLCFSENTASFHQKVGAPASGWIDIDQPQSHAVLGGTGNQSNGLNIESDLQFKVTDVRDAWNQASFGPQRQVCAEIEVQNSCNLERICWRTDGHWRLEKKVNAGQTTVAECGSSGETVVAQDDGSANLPTAFPLSVDSTYGLQISASRPATSTTSSSVQLKFTRSSDNTSKVVSLSNVPLSWSNGFSGVRNDRMAIRANLAGMKPTQSGASSRCGVGVDCQGTTASHVQGGAEGLTGPLSCNYSGTYAPPENLRLTRSDCKATMQMEIAWSAPANVPSPSIAGYRIMRDGYELIAGPRPELAWTDGYNLIGGRTYTYQVAWVDTAGKLRDVATLKAVAPLPCTGTTLADGKIKFGAVFMRFSDAPGALEPFTMASTYDQLFTVPTSLKAFISELSRNSVTLEGQTHGWITLPWAVHDRCHVLAPDGTGGNCNWNYSLLKDIARQNGVPVDSYEEIAFFINGMNDGGNSAGGTSVIGLTFGWQGPHIRTEAIAHEMLHNLGQRSHSTYMFCNNAGAISFVPPNLGDMKQGGCGLSEYGAPYDVMGANMGPLTSMGLFQLKWLQPTEVVEAKQGKSYWIGRLNSNVYPTKQLLISLDHPFVYYVDYRTAAGFNGLDPCPTCDPSISKSNVAKQGILVNTWRQDILYDGQVNEFAGVAPVQMGYANGGVNLLPAGATFRDPYRGLSLNVLEQNADGARVSLAWDCTDCPADNSCHGVGCMAATCKNGQLDAGETGVDCGGQCDLCPLNTACNNTGDCQSGVCAYGKCTPASCTNSVKDPGELDVDCGGACAHRCDAGQACGNNTDCSSNLCQNAVCASSCVNGVQDNGETGVDCGGSCQACACTPQSCPGNHVWNCATARCELPLPGSCVDGAKNNRETDVDCGGGYCSACTETKACSAHADCRAGLSCVGGTCKYAASCHDGVRSGSWLTGESDIDCGGPCAPCAELKLCRAASDCARGMQCLGGQCYAISSCTDQQQLAPETDYNCGGGACRACDDRDGCVIPEDCNAGSTCVEGTCRPVVTPATCNNGVKNGPYSTGETSIDCGGPCRPCTTEGAACLQKGDCDENLGLGCFGGECWALSALLCSNVRNDLYETSVDCGGDFCGPCVADRDCIENSDCQSNLVCISSSCTAAP